MAQVMTGEPSTLFIITLRISPVSGSRDLGPESWLVSTLWLSVWVWLRPRWYQWHLTLPQCQLGTEYYILNSDLIYKSVVSWLDTDNPVFTFSSRALDISQQQHVQSESYPSRGKDQKRKLLCHRHFCNEFAANNRPEDKEMTLFTNPTFWVSIIILLLCFVLLRFIQVYSVFSGDCIHSITRVKMIESLLCAYCKGCTWLILNSLSKHPWSNVHISVDHLCRLFISDSNPPITFRRDGHIQFDMISISCVRPPGMEMYVNMLIAHTILDCCGYPSLNQTIAIKLVICILRYWGIW